MAKELFNQTVQTSIASRTTKVFAFGEPAQSGCENITIENFCKNEIGLNGTTGNVGYLNNTTKKLEFESLFTYDSANNRLGVGITAPTSKIHIDGGTATASYLQFTANATTGQAVTDGTLFGIDSSGNSIWNNQENTSSFIKVNAVNKIAIAATSFGLYDSSGNLQTYIKNDAASLYNLWIGSNLTGSSNTAGTYNTGIGLDSLYASTGSNNTAVGYRAAYLKGNATYNTFLGSNCGANATGTTGYNTFVGGIAGYYNAGEYNTFVGYLSGANNTTANYSYSTCLGAGSGRFNGGSGVFVGYYSGYNETAANKLYIDNQSRGNEATTRLSALIYGEFNATVTSQYVTINGDFNVRHKVSFLNNLGYYADDTAAAAGGIAVNQLYRNGSVVMIRVA